jgi:hypothetical protein
LAQGEDPRQAVMRQIESLATSRGSTAPPAQTSLLQVTVIDQMDTWLVVDNSTVWMDRATDRLLAGLRDRAVNHRAIIEVLQGWYNQNLRRPLVYAVREATPRGSLNEIAINSNDPETAYLAIAAVAELAATETDSSFYDVELGKILHGLNEVAHGLNKPWRASMAPPLIDRWAKSSLAGHQQARALEIFLADDGTLAKMAEALNTESGQAALRILLDVDSDSVVQPSESRQQHIAKLGRSAYAFPQVVEIRGIATHMAVLKVLLHIFRHGNTDEQRSALESLEDLFHKGFLKNDYEGKKVQPTGNAEQQARQLAELKTAAKEALMLVAQLDAKALVAVRDYLRELGEPVEELEARVAAIPPQETSEIVDSAEALFELLPGLNVGAQKKLFKNVWDNADDLGILFELWGLLQIETLPVSWSESARDYFMALTSERRLAIAGTIEAAVADLDEKDQKRADAAEVERKNFLRVVFDHYSGLVSSSRGGDLVLMFASAAKPISVQAVLAQMSESSFVDPAVREAMAADLAVFSQRFKTSLKILIGTLKFLESRPSEDASADAEVVADLKATVAAALLSDEGLRLLPELGLEAPVPLTGDGKTAPLSGQIKRLVRGAAAGRKAAEVPGGSEAQRGVAWLERQLAEKGGSILAASGEDLTTSGFKMALIEAGRTTVAEARGPIVRLTTGVERLRLSGGRR